MTPIDNKVEGWTWLRNARKWHYFRGGHSVCGQRMLLLHPREGYELGNNESPDNCPKCRAKLAKEAAKAAASTANETN